MRLICRLKTNVTCVGSSRRRHRPRSPCILYCCTPSSDYNEEYCKVTDHYGGKRTATTTKRPKLFQLHMPLLVLLLPLLSSPCATSSILLSIIIPSSSFPLLCSTITNGSGSTTDNESCNLGTVAVLMNTAMVLGLAYRCKRPALFLFLLRQLSYRGTITITAMRRETLWRKTPCLVLEYRWHQYRYRSFPTTARTGSRTDQQPVSWGKNSLFRVKIEGGDFIISRPPRRK